MQKEFILLLLTFIFSTQITNAQSGSLEKAANEAFELERYEYAKDLYIQLELRQPDLISKFPYLKKIALCYKNLNRPMSALKYFEEALDIYPILPDSTKIEYAETLILTGNYSKGLQVLNEIEENSTKINKLKSQASYGLTDSTNSNVDVKPLFKQPAIQNFGITTFENKLVKILPYSSKTNYYSYNKIFIGNSEIENRINDKVSKLNNFSYPSFDENNNDLYFTANATNSSEYTRTLRKLQKISKDGENNLFIYKLSYNRYNDVPEALPFNNVEFSCIHPSIGDKGNILFFASDMPGGFGGYDIYMVRKEKSGWSNPVNMGPEVNTPFNEGYPFIVSDTLYFSSRGHKGYGGMDIYAFILDTKELKNMGKPINSSFDDLNYIWMNSEKSYLISNRKRSTDIDQIYKVTTK